LWILIIFHLTVKNNYYFLFIIILWMVLIFEFLFVFLFSVKLFLVCKHINIVLSVLCNEYNYYLYNYFSRCVAYAINVTWHCPFFNPKVHDMSASLLICFCIYNYSFQPTLGCRYKNDLVPSPRVHLGCNLRV
jgi:hypothetical protein